VLGNIEGKLVVEDGTVTEGTMVDVFAAADVRERTVIGAVSMDNGEAVLELLVRVPSDDFLDLMYTLKKRSDGNVAGKYVGTWRPVEKAVSARFTGGPFTSDATGREYYTWQGAGKLTPRKDDDKSSYAAVELREVA